MPKNGKQTGRPPKPPGEAFSQDNKLRRRQVQMAEYRLAATKVHQPLQQWMRAVLDAAVLDGEAHAIVAAITFQSQIS